MNYIAPFFNPFNCHEIDQIGRPYKLLENALYLVKKAVQGEKEDELFYDYLISLAPTEEEKNIIGTIRDDERKHDKFFREIYKFYTGQSIPEPTNVEFEKPKSYIDGIRKAKFGELAAVEKYRDIRAGMPYEYYKDMVFEILTDELKHAHKYDYILYLSLQTRNSYRQEKEFILDELAQYDGSMGRPAYIAINGIVYDISNESIWGGATHFNLAAGKDLTEQFKNYHDMDSILKKLPRVGILKN